MNVDKNCKHLFDSLSEYVDGTLQQAFCDEIEQHIANCENCRIVINTLEKTIYLYHETAGEPKIPPDVRTRLFQRLNLDEFINGSAKELGR
ncbi:MAG: zf-HC2 domain-containing protein [Anaerolineae bacterium]|nr:zf-HC2 domain-containing protein [Anaerolineae bacterium]